MHTIKYEWIGHTKNDTESTTILFRFCFEYTNQLTDRQTRKQTRTLTLFHSKVDYLITYVIYTKGFVCFIVEVFIVIFVVIYNITIWNRIIQSWENTISSHDYKHNHHHHDRDDCKIVSDKIKKKVRNEHCNDSEWHLNLYELKLLTQTNKKFIQN